ERDAGDGPGHEAKTRWRGWRWRCLGIGGGRVAEQESGFADVAQAVLRIAGEAAREEVAVGGRNGVEVGLLLEHSAEHLYGVVAIEEAVAGEHFVGDDAEGPDVGAAVDFFAAGLLGRHVGGGA